MNLRFHIPSVTVAIAAFLIAPFAFSLPVLAAPQLLAVAATPTPQPLRCSNGVCAADFSSFCLQKQRSNPQPGTAYTPYDETSFTLIYADSAGAEHRVPANDMIRITSKRGFTAVKAELDEQALKDLNAVSAALSVSGGATLIPVPVAGDDDPIRPDEIETAVSTLRPLADQWLSGAGDKSQAVGIVNTLINLTPLEAPLSGQARAGLWDRTWQRVAAYSPEAGGLPGQAAVERARDMYDACLWRVEIGRYPTMRDCLGVKHDSLLQDMNLSYWKASGAGS